MLTRNFYLANIGPRVVCDMAIESDNSKVMRFHQMRAVNGDLIPVVSGYGATSGGATSLDDARLLRYNVFVKNTKSELLCDTSFRTSMVSANIGVFFGSGTEQPTFDDYAPSGEIFTTYTVSYTCEDKYDENGIERTIHYTLTNTGSEEFTIGEVGMLTSGCQKASTSRYYYYHILVERTALETPITIPAGGVGQVTYTIQMNYPVA